jgi:hypothetical protein
MSPSIPTSDSAHFIDAQSVTYQTHTYDPEQWLETLKRTLKEYTATGLEKSVKDDQGNVVGLDVYEVIFEFPATIDMLQRVPFEKVLIHFEIDDIVNEPLGFGDNIFRDNFNDIDDTIRPQEAKMHRVNFDVGIWSSDRSGGTTQRLRAYQVLENLFHGARASKALWNASTHGDGGIEILQYTGGRFITERVGDVVTYRSVDGQLEVRVFSRTPMGEPEPAITTTVQQPGLNIVP